VTKALLPAPAALRAALRCMRHQPGVWHGARRTRYRVVLPWQHRTLALNFTTRSTIAIASRALCGGALLPLLPAAAHSVKRRFFRCIAFIPTMSMLSPSYSAIGCYGYITACWFLVRYLRSGQTVGSYSFVAWCWFSTLFCSLPTLVDIRNNTL
jgi:hypothetical protein